MNPTRRLTDADLNTARIVTLRSWGGNGVNMQRRLYEAVSTSTDTITSAPAHERAIRTLMNWNIHVDEAMFLGGLPKGEFLREFEPDFFFDDQTGHVDHAARHVPSGHVAGGIANLPS